MKILVACEESQAVTKAFRARGHETFSCDIESCSGGHPEWHKQGDALFTMRAANWDMVIAFPPCTHLCSSGARWFKEKQADGRQDAAIRFFMAFVEHQSRTGVKMAIENPVGIMSTHYRKPDQIIQPYEYGHGETKATCLWLFGLPKLIPTNIVDGREQRIWRMAPGKGRARERSKTFPGIAEAMSSQWTRAEIKAAL